MLAAGSISNAASRANSSAVYSATLLVAIPTASEISFSTFPLSASITTAPAPEIPGLPREPPSASIISFMSAPNRPDS